MAQFDVYPNPSKTTKKFFPYIVDIQSPVISEIATRLVVPLGKIDKFKNEQMKNLTIKVEHEGEKLILLVPQLASIPSKVLKKPIGSLSHMRDEIIAAIDFAITGI